eukprot:CAMPEP_0180411810 /NCGR_PEP_ID=MMETSP0989-20121125/44192_1 /TAXON_ID=697907 /ORGANISM="non described non described, Strain CCMP2293" /LENGTH=81 /DNA_ID=CAMNT_0022416207 /DNA_START=395 /DNA_END=640 /DNA_ORIENTATION=+
MALSNRRGAEGRKVEFGKNPFQPIFPKRLVHYPPYLLLRHAWDVVLEGRESFDDLHGHEIVPRRSHLADFDVEPAQREDGR